MIVKYPHYSYVREWFWDNFTPKEIACKGTGEIVVNYHALYMLQSARDIVNKPLYINSAYRSERYNSEIGGAPMSMHLEGRAFDISLKGHDKDDIHEILKRVGFTGFGLRHKTFIHADNGRRRTW